MRFLDRSHAGRELAAHLSDLRGEDVIVLGLPRGGVPVAFEVARAIGARLDVWVARKIGAPHQPELGIGAVGEGGARVVDPRLARLVGVDEASLERATAAVQQEVERRARRFRPGPPPRIAGRIVVLVDDGLATGVTARAALRDLRARSPRRLILAVPVASLEASTALAAEADEVVCVEASPTLRSVGAFYVDFRQTSDDEVDAALRAARDGAHDGGEVVRGS